ncbi:MAG: sigma-70 family RNA polymerase sigma factor [Ignavibacteriae bacterium]|nr:sigma-70 family RNA polymerase sigma factor [Ignavibacteriota bacterium]
MNQAHDDLQLVRSFQAGDEKAFETLVRRYQRQVANIIYLTMGDRADIEDLAQEAFLRVYKSLGRFEFDSSFYSWLYRIVVNLCIDEIRRRKIRRALSLDFFTEDRLEKETKSIEPKTGLEDVLGKEKKDTVLMALEKLSQEHKTVLVLREYNDMSYDEIAKVLGITPQAVKSRIFRARTELREFLKEYFHERL